MLISLIFAQPLTRLVTHVAEHELHSYILLVPFLTIYLLRLERSALPTEYGTSLAWSVAAGTIGVVALATSISLQGVVSRNDALSLSSLSYFSFIAAGGFLFLGRRWMTAAAFPFGFLLFMIPLPDAAVDWLERASVLGSAEVASWLFGMSGTPMLREGTVFALPTIVLEVAQECSGIRSSWVLFITSVLASHLLLTSPWRRLALVAFVIPLGIVRNGFRILTIGVLCVRIGPHMIDSPIHHQGGPIFFALSLVPLFLWLVWLRRGDNPSNSRHRRAHVDFISAQASAKPQ